ncbi:hypothetical protein [Flavobacterium sp. U410]
MIQEITTEDKDKIKNWCEEFLCLIPSHKSLQGFCFTICYPLSLYTNYKGFKNSLSAGQYDGKPHYWINLDNYNNVIIDPTVTQFEQYLGNDKIYIGKKDCNYYQVYDYLDIRINQARDAWKEKLYDNKNIELLQINFKIALKIFTEIEEKDFSKTGEYVTYINDIKEITETLNIPKDIVSLKTKLSNWLFNNCKYDEKSM